MSSLFEEAEAKDNYEKAPLAERVRPKKLDEFWGHQKILGKNAPLKKMIESGNFPSMILWGPPGCGKTTLAKIIAKQSGYIMHNISAVDAGVKDIRAIIQHAEKSRQRLILFIDEIHRFNKSQQDALLHSVESGVIKLIGATTENPSFEVNGALLSRCRVFRLSELTKDDISTIINNAILNDNILNKYKITFDNYEEIFQLSGGDARSALNILEQSFWLGLEGDNSIITADHLQKAAQIKVIAYDKNGENHYDTISAFIKSLRGSDPDAALIWLAKMIEAGEDPKFIARRMTIFASEDIGNADPYAITLAVSVFNAVNLIGMPESYIILAQGVTYLASAPKSNASYMAINKALNEVKSKNNLTVPIHLRNAPTKLMKSEGFGKEYKYPHDYPNSFVNQDYFPEEIDQTALYRPKLIGREAKIAERLVIIRPERYEKEN